METSGVACAVIEPDVGGVALRLAFSKRQAHVYGTLFRWERHPPDRSGRSPTPQRRNRPAHALGDALIVRVKKPWVSFFGVASDVFCARLAIDIVHYTWAMGTTSVSISSALRGRPGFRLPLPSYFCAISFRCQASSVSGVTIVATSSRSFFPQSLGLDGQATTLVVGKPQAAIPKLLAQDTVLFLEVLYGLQLALVHPPSNGDQDKSEWIQYPGHLVYSLSRRSQRSAADSFRSSFRTMLDSTGALPPNADAATKPDSPVLYKLRGNSSRWIVDSHV